MAESELIASYQLPDGEKVQKFRASDGEISYRRGDGTFVSPTVGEGIEERASRNTGQKDSDSQVQFIVTPQSQQDRQEAIKKRYPEYDNVERLDPNQITGSESEEQRLVKGWMNNQTLEQQIKNDPLLQTDRQQKLAKEARARQIANDLQEVESESEAIRILRQYGVES
jgi:hypothetical protein